MSTFAAVGLYSAIFQVLWGIGAIVAAILLLIAYSRQRHAGYLWLLAATVVWPFIMRGALLCLTLTMPQLMASHQYTVVQFTIIQLIFNGVLQLIDVVLLVIAAQRFLAGAKKTEQPVYPAMPPVGEWPAR